MMEAIVRENLEGVTFGKIQIHHHVAVIPTISADGSGSDYLTMKEAMEGRFMAATELTEGGEVTELKVINRGDKPVLLLDGEELSGVKQNRMLNTTILIREKSETVIPVSCTEHGRWSYSSSHFNESGYIMSAKLRRVKDASVHENLKTSRTFRSDQGAIRDEIAVQSRVNKVSSATGAMRDVLEAKQENLDLFLEHLPIVVGRNGLLDLVNREITGFDMVSRAAAFKVLHLKLIRSYVMDALTERPAACLPSPAEGRTEPIHDRGKLMELLEHYEDLKGKVIERKVSFVRFLELLEGETTWLASPANTRRHLAKEQGFLRHSVGVAETLLCFRKMLAPAITE